jgi:hypothetical protein
VADYRTDLQSLEHSVAVSRKRGTSRRRVLKGAGAGLVASAMAVFIPAQAANAAPAGCYGYPTCSCCSGKTCCFPKCYRLYTCGGNQCWYTCSSGCGYCCDWTICDYYGNNCKSCICKGK